VKKIRNVVIILCSLVLLVSLACNLVSNRIAPPATAESVVEPAAPPTQMPTQMPTLTPMPTALPRENPFEGPVAAGALARIGRGTARSIALSPDGESIAVATTIGVYLYRSDSMTSLWFKPFHSPVVNVVFHPDGARLAALTTSHIYLLDTAQGEPVGERISNATLEGIAAWSPDGKWLATASNLVIKLWDMASGEAITELTGHAKFIQSLAWAPDGTQLVSGATAEDGETGEIIVWKPTSGEILHQFGGQHSRSVSSLVFNSDGTRLMADAAREVIVWDMASFTPLHTIESTHILSAAWSPDDTLLAFGLTRGRMQVFDAASATELYQVEDQRIDIRAVAFSPDNRLLYSFDTDGTIHQRQASSGEVQQRAAGFGTRLGAGVWTPDGTAIWAGVSGGQIALWDTNTFEQLHLEGGFGSPGLTGATITALAYHDTQNLLAVGGSDGRVYLYEPDKKEVVASFGDRESGHRNAIERLRWSADGARLASSGIDNTLVIWDVAAQAPMVRFDDPDARFAGDLDFTPDGSMVVVASRDHSLYVLDPVNGTIIRQWNPDQGAQRGLSWHPSDANLFITASMNVTLWDFASGEAVRIMEKASGFNFPYSVAFSPDGKLIVAGGSGGEVALWDAATGAVVAVYEKPHTDSVNTVIFHPDGSQFATVSFDGTILIWDMP